MTNEELQLKLIKEQDLVTYNIVNFADKTILFDYYSKEYNITFLELNRYLLDNIEILKQYSTKNLISILGNVSLTSNPKQVEEIGNLIMQRLEKEPFDCEVIETEFNMHPIYTINSFVNKIKQHNFNKIKNGLKDRIAQIEDKYIRTFIINLTSFPAVSGMLNLVENGELNKEKFKIIKELFAENKNILVLMNYGIFKDDIFDLGVDFIKTIAKFPNLSKSILILHDNNRELFKFLKEEIKSSPKLENDYEKIEAMILYFNRRCFEIDASNLTEQSKEDLIEWAINSNSISTDKIKLDNPLNYRGNINSECDKKYKEGIDIENKKNILFSKYYSLSISEVRKLIEEYPEEDNRFFSEIKAILEINSVEQLNNVYDSKQGTYYKSQEVLEILRNSRSKYKKEYSKVLGETSHKLENIEPEYIEYKGKKIKQIFLSGEFDLLAHSSDSGFINEINLKDNSFKKTWRKGKDVSNNIISTTYINEDFLGTAPVNEKGVRYGFSNVSENKIANMGKTDINTYSRNFAQNSAEKEFLYPSKMRDNSRRVYVEVGIERKNTIPDYIILFNDDNKKIVENSYKAASEFNIPIVYIDKELIKDEQINRLEKRITEFSKRPSIESFAEIMNKYETNIAGWLLNRLDKDDLNKDDSHTQTINNNNFRDDFEKVLIKIKDSFLNYMKKIIIEEKDPIKLTELMKVFLRENDKYRGTEKDKPISQTHISYDVPNFIENINAIFEELNLTKFIVNSKNIPKEEEYSKSILEFIRVGVESGIDKNNLIELEEIRNKDNIQENKYKYNQFRKRGEIEIDR